MDKIIIDKASVHNLKGISLEIPKNTLTVITGPSGSGKSSLAFDTIYVEGQRRYIESLSSYARQFLGQYNPPDVESISGLSPAIAIDQKSTSKNPRSTVGTITEIYDYLRILYARVGKLYCPTSNQLVQRFTPSQITREILKEKENTKIHILSPVKLHNNAKTEISKFMSMGFSRVRVNGEIRSIEDTKSLSKINELDVVIDRIILKSGIKKRLTESIEYAFKLSGGYITILVEDREFRYSEHFISPVTGELFPELEPRLFSFNSPIGACKTCNGIGQSKYFELDLIVFDDSLPTLEGAIKPLSKRNTFMYQMVKCVAKAENINLNLPLRALPKSFTDILYYGSKKVYKYVFKSENSNFDFKKKFPGIINWLEKKYLETGSDKTRLELEDFMRITRCHDCNGLRLNSVALSTKISDKNIMDISSMSIENAQLFFKNLKLEGDDVLIARKLLKEITNRLSFLTNVGLGYLTLNRSAMTLSGGESQRIRLATQIGSSLSGVLYVLDEPSIGLHQRDNIKLIQTLKNLRDLGNTVLVVEHDEETMMHADHIIDMGPGAGVHGGRIIAQGTLSEITKVEKSLTSQYLTKSRAISIPAPRRKLSKSIKLRGASENNLDNLDVEIPLGGIVSLTGVSGSGKSTLVHNILVPAIRNYLSKRGKHLHKMSNYHSISGVDSIQSVIELDQSPIGRTPHSNPATYSGLFDHIRTLFSKTQESQIRGYKPGRFSFNIKGGRCDDCEGNGVKKIEMHFLPDVYITCGECKGTRYNPETLSVLYKGLNIADVLNLTIEEALEFFKNHPQMNRILSTLNDVGLGYMNLGQPATTLSGGEAQRLKLSKELAKKTRGHCLYILDEPTTGLHFEDINLLLSSLNNLVEQGHSVLIIEHNLDVIKNSDHIIDLGPEGGDKGGKLVAEGSPEKVAKVKSSHTGTFLNKILN